ncbi:MAG: RNA polymerase sigma factor [Paraclostridium sp.]
MLIYLSMLDRDEDKSKFEEIYNTYRKTMFYVAKQILKDDYLSEDAVHMSFIKIMKNLSKIDKVDSPRTKGFIVIIVKRVSIDIYRKLKKENITSIDELSYSNDTSLSMEDNYDEGNEIMESIKKLPNNYREVILLKFSHGLSDYEIAKVLGISKDNVAKRIQRGKKKLNQLVNEIEVV